MSSSQNERTFFFWGGGEGVRGGARKQTILKNSLGNVNASVVICAYPQIYNFSFRKEFLETL